VKRLFLATLTLLSVTGIQEAWSFQPGERVTIGSANQSGVVIEDTGKLVKVRLDSQTGYSAGVGVWYDKEEHKVSSGTVATESRGQEGASAAPSKGGNASTTTNSPAGKQVKIGNQTGTILEESGDLVKVRLDSHAGYGEGVGVWYTRAQLNGNGGAGSAAAGKHDGIAIRDNQNAHTVPVNQKPNAQTAPAHAAQAPQANQAPAAEKGLGAPPDGLYTCNKISGRSYIHIGTIEIRGGTYKGFSSQQGSFHPYSLSGSGDIVWTGGLTSLPEGWTLKPGKYVGPDSSGHPRIRVFYTSNRGAAEVIDATKEK